ncbi:DUF3558 domain-containing protein [Herbihabitans rhizosphaerae]|uniref:DUF3558 domain-containing protein n=1 Tax=Herbihabitans rhizosphaerae TaxID=1872711 RepID=UPI0013EE6985|nr:DUF3558 domain-containing protein [Herbihabitans rhizosphaerae]
MSSRRGWAAVVALSAVLLTVGCDSGSTGNATPGPPASGTTATEETTIPQPTSGSRTRITPSRAPSVEIPPRPRAIPIVGVDPCALVTSDQQRELRAAAPWRAPYSEKLKAESCLLNAGAQPRFTYYVSLTTRSGIEPFLTPGGANTDARLVNIGGYGAAEYKLMGVEDTSCDVSIDIAPGQQLENRVDAVTGYYKQAQLCQFATQLAHATLKTLQAIRP